MLETLTLIGNFPGPHLLITAGVHGDEYEPMEACRKIHKTLNRFQNKLKGKITLVPVVNKPAFEMNSRTGKDELDLARTCPGNKKGTETEQIAYAVSQLIKTADYYIDLHNGGKLHNIYPFVGYMLHPNKAVLEQQRQLATSFLLPIIWGTDSKMEGRTLSVARDENIPAIYTEIGGAGIYDDLMMTLTYEGCMNVIKHLGMIPENQNKKEPKYHLEDFRENSGHLQKLLPAPCDGFYIPIVTFGQRVKTGDLIGYIQDNVGENTVEVKANQDGVIFILRNPPSVKKGDGLGAILPVNENNKMQSIYD